MKPRFRRFIGMREWRGKDATDEPWCETGGICDECLARIEKQAESIYGPQRGEARAEEAA